MTKDRELLQQLADFLNARDFVYGDKNSIMDMVQRYGNPPLTRHYQVAMRMTIAETRKLNILLRQINEHLQPTEV